MDTPKRRAALRTAKKTHTQHQAAPAVTSFVAKELGHVEQHAAMTARYPATLSAIDDCYLSFNVFAIRHIAECAHN
ncbi:MAG: hypothetical protein ABSB70_12970 [Candidatus Velthaea sp.]|jgi:hypothetical protein